MDIITKIVNALTDPALRAELKNDLADVQKIVADIEAIVARIQALKTQK